MQSDHPGAEFDPSDFRNHVPRFSPEARKANLLLVHAAETDAKRKCITTAQFALAWLLAQKPWIVPIPKNNQGEAYGGERRSSGCDSDEAELKEIDGAVSKLALQGERLPEAMLKMTGC